MPDAELISIAEYHNDVVSALKAYFGNAGRASALDPRNSEAIAKRLTLRLIETDQRSAFFILARMEAVFRDDYERRCRLRKKDPLSRAFQDLWKKQKKQTTRVRLDQDLFELWRSHVRESRRVISELRSAFSFRHLMAHGRLNEPKLWRKYDFNYTYGLAEAVLISLPLCKSD
jgi:hypothetical protein